MQTLFECEFESRRDPKEVLAYNLKNFVGKASNYDFAEQLLAGVHSKLTEVKKAITKHAPEWPIEQIAPVDRAILYVGAYEILFVDHDDVPPVVAINEAIEVSKEYGGDNSSKFINGVLSAIYKKQSL